ncbi:MAG: hypothetical protein IBX52_02990 [Bacterioplanes sp.]|nr:hypothetical protein [Bacterioplanes sp.]
MVKKTLLSLAIAASTASLIGCNISSVDTHNNDIDLAPVEAGQPGSTPNRVAPIFSAASGKVPVAIDLLFARAATTDGTADTADTTPPVTTAINKLDGFSTSAAIYLDFNAELDPSTVVAGQTVFLIKLRNAEDNANIDALNIDSILANSPGGIPFAGDQPTSDDYEANYITLDDGATHAIQILPKKPLDPKTKYLVALTNGIKSADGRTTGPSAEYELMRGDLGLPSPALQPVRNAVKGWEQLAGGFLANATNGNLTKDNLILSYSFTTGGTTDVLKAMAAPGIFLTSQIPNIATAEGAISQKVIATALVGGLSQEDAEAAAAGTLLQIAQGTALKINASTGSSIPIDGTTRDVLLASEQLSPSYYIGLISTIANGQDEGLDAIVDKPQSRTFEALVLAPNTPVAVSYDAFLTAQITPRVIAEITKNVTDYWKAVTPEITDEDLQDKIDDALANGTTLTNAGGPDVDVDVPSQAVAVAAQVTALSSKGTIYQGGLEIPNYLPNAEAGIADAALGTWTASDAAAVALNLEQAPRDVNGSTNVTYRFPFADKLGDNVIPVMATLPVDDGDCARSNFPDGYPVVIYQHGITVDRTAGVLIGNALAQACVGMVAIDHAMHGVGPTSATGLVFNVDTIAAGAVDANGNPTAEAVKSPFAVARAGAIQANPDSFFANLTERHNNVGKAVPGGANVEMVFKDAAGAAEDAANVGASGDLYINLQNFARTRDGMRQTVLDMMNLNASIKDLDVNADGNSDFDDSKVYFIGHSLGGIIGTTFVSVNNDPMVQAYNSNLPKIQALILGNAGGGVTKLLENSPGIGATRILPGLNASGLEQGSSNLEKFFSVLQAMVDSADPINFAGAEHMQALPVLSYTAVNDNVVPNHALGQVKYDVAVVDGALTVVGATPGAVPTAKSYLSGTAPLDRELGIEEVVNGDTPVGELEKNRVSVRVAADESNHGTFSSADPQATFAEIFGQIGSFLSPVSPLNLNGINVQDTSVLEQVAE